MKRILKIILAFIALVIFITFTYVLYVSLQYYRIKDNTKLNIENNTTNNFEFDKEYKVLTYNIGFGAYDHDFSFFLDEEMKKEPVCGLYLMAKGLEVFLFTFFSFSISWAMMSVPVNS